MPFEFDCVLNSLYQYRSTIVTSGMQAIVGWAWVHAYATYGPLACTFLSSDYYDCHHAV